MRCDANFFLGNLDVVLCLFVSSTVLLSVSAELMAAKFKPTNPLQNPLWPATA